MQLRHTLAPNRLAAVSLGICLLGMALGTSAFWWESDFHQWSSGFELRGDADKGVRLSEAFAHGVGAMVILGTLLWIDVKSRGLLWQAFLITFGGGAIANLSKWAFHRVRPYAQDAQGIENAAQSWVDSSAVSFWEAHLKSFPSGHAATATALAIGLSLVYPRGKWIFAVLAAVASYQRVYAEAHYASDVFWGIAIGAGWGYLCLHSSLIGSWFRRANRSSSNS